MFGRFLKRFFRKGETGKEGVTKQSRTSFEKEQADAEGPSGRSPGNDAGQPGEGNSPEGGKVLVATAGDTFSETVIEYAVGFAERMGYKIIAVNVEPIDIEYTRSLGEYSEELCREFENRAKEQIKGFEGTARKRNIGFKHLIKFGDLNNCIKEVYETEKHVEFVITDPKETKDGNGKTIPVFCMTSEN